MEFKTHGVTIHYQNPTPEQVIAIEEAVMKAEAQYQNTEIGRVLRDYAEASAARGEDDPPVHPDYSGVTDWGPQAGKRFWGLDDVLPLVDRIVAANGDEWDGGYSGRWTAPLVALRHWVTSGVDLRSTREA